MRLNDVNYYLCKINHLIMPRKPKQLVRQYVKTHRNDACPCGSGKKYKNCCLSTGKYEKLIVKGTVVDENESEVA
jgi:hypothetical protein